jgi:hypothetical protein
MPTSTLLRAQRERVTAVDEAVGAWQGSDVPEGDTAQFVRWCAVDTEVVVNGWRAAWQQLQADRLQDHMETGSLLREIFDVLLHAAKTLRNIKVHLGGASAEVTELESVVRRLTGERSEFIRLWPWVSKEAAAESRAAFERGEYQSTEDILNELQGSGPEAG